MTEPSQPEVDTMMSDSWPRRPPPESERAKRRAIKGKALRILRVHRGLAQIELARRTGINKSTISSYERGERSARFESVVLMLGAMDFSLAALEAACRMVERLDSGYEAPDIDEMASQAGCYAESLVRWFAILVTTREDL